MNTADVRLSRRPGAVALCGSGGRRDGIAGRAAFSLPELIVVLGLMMLLMGLLAPATSRAWRQAEAIKCRAQLRDIGLAISMYANENRGVAAPFRGWVLGPAWPELLFDEPAPAIVVCPSGVGEDLLSYQLNQTLRWGAIRMHGNNAAGLPASRIVVAGESRPRQYLEFSFYDFELGEPSWDLARHGPGLLSNYLWLDGHVDNEPPEALPGSGGDPWWVPVR